GDRPAHAHVLAQEDGAHAALAEPLQELVLAAQYEIAVLAPQQLLGLEAGEQAGPRERLRERPRPGLRPAIFPRVVEEGVQRRAVNEPALAYAVEEGVPGGRSGHAIPLGDSPRWSFGIQGRNFSPRLAAARRAARAERRSASGRSTDG